MPLQATAGIRCDASTFSGESGIRRGASRSRQARWIEHLGDATLEIARYRWLSELGYAKNAVLYTTQNQSLSETDRMITDQNAILQEIRQQN